MPPRRKLLSIRNGLTLLELLLTLAVSGILLAAVSSAILVHYQTTDAGERQIDQARSLHAFAQRWRRDMATLTRETRRPGIDRIDREEFSDNQIRERVLNFGYAYSIDAVELWGDESILTLGRMVPTLAAARRQAPALSAETIAWSALPPRDWRIPMLTSQGGLGFMPLPSGFENMHHGVSRGVVRLGASNRLVEHLRYPSDLARVSFRYFDGQRWISRWNSVAQGGLPVAVEALLELRDDPQQLRVVHHLHAAELTNAR